VADVLKLVIDANAKGAQREIKATSGAVGGLGQAMKTAGALGIGFGSGMAVAQAAIQGIKSAIAAVPRLMMEALESTSQYGDSVAKMARATGVAAEQLQVLRFAGERGGVSTDQMDKALKKLSKSASDASDGLATYTRVFDRLGVEVTDAQGNLRQTDLIFRDLADAIQEQGINSQTTADLMSVLGRSGADLANVMLQGSEGVDAMDARLRELGGLMSDEALVGAEVYRDALLDLGVATDALQRGLGEQLMPTAIGVTGALTALAVGMSEVVDAANHSWASLTERLIVLESVLSGMSTSGGFLTGVIGSLVDISGGLADMSEQGTKAIEAQRLQIEKEAVARQLMFSKMIDELKTRGALTDATNDGAKAAAAQARELDRLATSVRFLGLTQEQTAELRFEDSIVALSEALDEGIISYDSYIARVQVLRAELSILDETREEDHQRQLRRFDEEAAAQQRNIDYTHQTIQSTADFAQAASSIVSSMYGRQSKEAKTAASVAFGVSQAAALAQATISMAVAIGKANELGYPQSIAAMIAAGATGAAQIATIAATTIAGVADSGLTEQQVKRATTRGHSTFVVQSGESIVDTGGTAEISRMLQLQRMQMERSAAGGGSGGGGSTIVVDGRVMGEVVGDRFLRDQERGTFYADRRRA